MHFKWHFQICINSVILWFDSYYLIKALFWFAACCTKHGNRQQKFSTSGVVSRSADIWIFTIVAIFFYVPSVHLSSLSQLQSRCSYLRSCQAFEFFLSPQRPFMPSTYCGNIVISHSVRSAFHNIKPTTSLMVCSSVWFWSEANRLKLCSTDPKMKKIFNSYNHQHGHSK